MTNLVVRTPVAMYPVFPRRMNRLFQDAFSDFSGSTLNETSVPAVIVYETTNEYVIQAELPGWARDQVSINFEKQTLILQGKRDLPNGEGRKYHRVEGFFGEFNRSFTLPDAVETNQITADLRDGVLTVHLPKKAEVKPRQITIETVS